jgi:hypothetical protein
MKTSAKSHSGTFLFGSIWRNICTRTIDTPLIGLAAVAGIAPEFGRQRSSASIIAEESYSSGSIACRIAVPCRIHIWTQARLYEALKSQSCNGKEIRYSCTRDPTRSAALFDGAIVSIRSFGCLANGPKVRPELLVLSHLRAKVVLDLKSSQLRERSWTERASNSAGFNPKTLSEGIDSLKRARDLANLSSPCQ